MPRLPVTLLSGFLGSGKTTLLSRLLRQTRMSGTAVVMNEFGEIALDHLLVATAGVQTVLLDGGCVCCAVRDDLAETLLSLHAGREAQDAPAFERVVIETSGLADPTAIAALLLRDPALAARFELDAVIVTVDALHASGQLDTQAEAVNQVMLADRLLLTKVDLVDTATREALCERLRMLNPAAMQLSCAHGEIEPSQVIGLHARGDTALDVTRWHVADPAQESGGHQGCKHDASRDHDPTCGHAAHDHGIRAHCICIDEPFDWTVLSSWLGSVAYHHGENILRMKAIVQVQDEAQPIVMHGVQRWLHEPGTLPAWPGEDRRSRFVFIVRNLPRAALTDALDAAWCEAGPGGADGDAHCRAARLV
ncbi:GTP-binding protein [Rhodanobacter sp. Si-c]|uniref:GTP-binding protein n=1 Tax=Rhodanobacter lycopersici TaxID=3162487 RepID=A0ABV3QGL7_9GAMM